ncbi:MAG: Eco57I restriction-modification methylase domain-containing protein [Erysipelothrix sp.]
MKLKKDSSSQKLRGIYYTPNQLAIAMINIFKDDLNIKKVLEPSCGDGVFIDAIVNSPLIDNIDVIKAIEIQDEEVLKIKKTYEKNKKINVEKSDFFNYYEDNYRTEKYDLIVGNPPYIRYQYLTAEQREIQSGVLTNHGMKSNKQINAWVGFMVASVQMLNHNGKLMFVIPAELLQVAYAEDLRLYLSNHFSSITLITFSKLVFPDIEQEVIVFIGERGTSKKGIRIYEMDDLDMFDKLDYSAKGFREILHVKEKWTKYYLSNEDIKLIQKIKKDTRFQFFSDIGTINVGITTGNNAYFTVDKETVEKYDLYRTVLPLIGRSSHAHGINFTEEDWKANINKGVKAFLVAFDNMNINELPSSYVDYINLGEATGQNLGYKCKIRNHWYVVPSIWIPDAFFLRRNNLYPKFVLNDCNAVSTDTMHRIKFNDDIDKKRIQLSYYNSVSFAFSEISGRSYGGGVLEILPSELSKIVLPKIDNIDDDKVEELLNFIDDNIRNNNDIEKVLEKVDNEILVGLLGMSNEECTQFRKIWKNLQNKRLGRMR